MQEQLDQKCFSPDPQKSVFLFLKNPFTIIGRYFLLFIGFFFHKRDTDHFCVNEKNIVTGQSEKNTDLQLEKHQIRLKKVGLSLQFCRHFSAKIIHNKQLYIIRFFSFFYRNIVDFPECSHYLEEVYGIFP